MWKKLYLKSVNLNNWTFYWRLWLTVNHFILFSLNIFYSYGLLGPSGCGKTTILRCIVGRMSLDSGDITVLGKEPWAKGHGIPGSLVGYMPQVVFQHSFYIFILKRKKKSWFEFRILIMRPVFRSRFMKIWFWFDVCQTFVSSK